MSFWVIFDVSQLKDYYADVHNLIALPPGAMIRYDYDHSLLSSAAIELAQTSRPWYSCVWETPAGWETNVLLLYEQKNCPYTRTDTVSKPTDFKSDSLIVGTRLGKLVNILQEGGRYYFDIRVGKYPAQTQANLVEIVRELGPSRLPWAEIKDGLAMGKFVSVSHADEAYNRLVIPDDQKGWKNVVSSLSRSPIQFSGDVFWRLTGPYKRNGKSPIEPRILKQSDSKVVRRADAVYEIQPGPAWRFELFSYMGRHIGRPQYQVEITSSDNTALKLSGGSPVSLRRNATQTIQFRAEPAERLMAATAELSFTTISKSGDWPSGPNFKLQFETHENRVRFTFGLLFLLIGTIGVITGKSELMKECPLPAVIIEIAGWLSGLLAGALLIRKLSLPGS